MVAAFLQDDLIEELKRILKGFKLKTPTGELSEINIFAQNLPVPKPLKQENLSREQLESGLVNEVTEADPYPYIIVRIEEGEIKDEFSAQTVNTLLIIGVYEDAYDKQGQKDVLNIIAKVYERFAKRDLLNKRYVLQYPVSWMLQEEESYPYYFGGMSLRWETAAIRREDDLA